MQLTNEDVELLNSKIGLRYLTADPKIDIEKVLRLTRYETNLKELQADLIRMQTWVIDNNKKVVVLCEGRDSAGKGGAIRRMTAYINPRYYRTVALSKPNSEEEGQWYFQRYVNQLPNPGEMVFFDRSWYNRAVLEPVNDFCTIDQYETFMNQVNEFERMIIDANTYLIKLYFSISKREQAKRFEDIQKDPLKKWKMSAVDRKAQKLWDVYTDFKEKMFAKTNSEKSPWIIIEANRKTNARVEAIQHLLHRIPFQ